MSELCMNCEKFSLSNYWRLDYHKWLDSRDFCSLKCLIEYANKLTDDGLK